MRGLRRADRAPCTGRGRAARRAMGAQRLTLPVAVICVMHGISLGLAIDIACCADMRLCASNTRFSVKEVDIGLAADVGTLSRLPKIVGSASWVKDVCLTARDFSAEEALGVGFVSRVLPDKREAVEAGIRLATRIAEKSPVAVQGTKELLNHARDHGVAESKWAVSSLSLYYRAGVWRLTRAIRRRLAIHGGLELCVAAVRGSEDGTFGEYWWDKAKV